MIPFNKAFLTGEEIKYIGEVLDSRKLSGNRAYTRKCQQFFEKKYRFKKSLLTTSCTDALEMCSLLLKIEPGDEVIIPSYTFVSTANAFALRGAKIIFADSREDHPNIDEDKIEALITPNTKAIVLVHYAGVACEMDTITDIAKKHNVPVVEDAAQAIDSYYKGRPLGGIGDLSSFSFHETKNIISGEGGLLAINRDDLVKRAEIIWEKGTNRTQFYRGEVDKYNWIDLGSSFLPPEIISAFLYSQLEQIENIQARRKKIWNNYYNGLNNLDKEGVISLPKIPEYATNNAHMFYLICQNQADRDGLISYLKEHDVHAVFHYFPLHNSPYFKDKHDGRELMNSKRFSDTLIRLPLYCELSVEDQNRVIDLIQSFFHQDRN